MLERLQRAGTCARTLIAQPSEISNFHRARRRHAARERHAARHPGLRYRTRKRGRGSLINAKWDQRDRAQAVGLAGAVESVRERHRWLLAAHRARRGCAAVRWGRRAAGPGARENWINPGSTLDQPWINIGSTLDKHWINIGLKCGSTLDQPARKTLSQQNFC